MSSKIDKDMLNNPDVFITTSDHIFNFVERHAKTAAGLFVAAIVIALGYVTYGYVSASREQSAAEAIYKVEAELQKAQADHSEKPAAGLKKTPPEPPKPADYAKDYAPSVEKIKAQIQAHSGTKAAMVAALNLSYFLGEQKQVAPSLDVLQAVTFKPAEGDLLNGFWLMHRGVAFLENNQPDPAIVAYQGVLKAAGLKIFHAEALLKLGIAFQTKGDGAKARESFEKVAREFPESEASSTAQQYLRLLDLKKQG